MVRNGIGRVSYGGGKDGELPHATDKVYAEAVRNADYIKHFENRTVWTKTQTKLGATKDILRPRHLGFGLRCNPNVRQVLKAARIKDYSVKVWSSRNPLNVIKAMFRMLQLGKDPVEQKRGRKMLDLKAYWLLS